MKNKNLFALSPALIIENFKMYWYIPALSLVLYFFGGIFPIIVNYDDLYKISYTISNNFQNLSWVFVPLLIFVPLVAACVMMSFFHKGNRAFALHAQPYSKSRLFNSQIFTGWLMCVLPLIVMSLLYLLLMKEVTPDASSSLYKVSDYSLAAENVYTAGAVLGWLGDSLVIVTFFYGMFVFAGSLVGTGVMQLLISGVFFIIVPAMIFIINTFCETFLLGYVGMSDFMESLMLEANPIFRIISGWGDSPGLALEMKYLAAAVIMLCLARFAYGKAKLEKVGDSMIFRATEEILTYLVTFIGMTTFGAILYGITNDKRSMLILGMVVGGLVTFLIVKIVIARSIKVFNKKNLASLCIYIVIAAVFTGFTVLDLGGFSKRLPDENKIQSVSLSNSTLWYASSPTYMYGGNGYSLGQNPVLSTDPEVISAMYELEKYIVEKDLFTSLQVTIEDSDSDEPEPIRESVTFEYKMKNGSNFRRGYYFNLDEESKELINRVVTSEDWKAYFSGADKINLSGFESATLETYSLSADYYADEQEKISISREDVEKLVAARDEDFKAVDYYDMCELIDNRDSHELFGVSVNVVLKTPVSDGKTMRGIRGELSDTLTIGFDLMKEDKNTLAVLKEIGVI